VKKNQPQVYQEWLRVVLASAIKQIPLPTGRFLPDFSPATG
jgi:hypothetical protein